MARTVIRLLLQGILIWAICCGLSLAQTTDRLKPDAERLKYANEVYQKAITKHDSLLLAEAWYLYGKTYVFAGDYRTAQIYFLKSLRIQETRGNSPELSRLYVRLCENERRQRHFPKALDYANLALRIAQSIRSDKELIRSYGAIGHLYEGMWSNELPYDRATYNRIHAYYTKAEQLCLKLHDSVGAAEASIDLGVLYNRMKDPRAIPTLEKAVALFKSKQKDGILVKAMLNLSTAYLVAQKNSLAFRTIQEAEKLYEHNKLNEFDSQRLLAQNYMLYFQTIGQWEQAFAQLKKLNDLDRSQLLSDQDGAISRLNIEYETEKKEAQLQAQNRELALQNESVQTQQRLTLTLLALFVMTASMSIIFFWLNRKNKRISKQKEELVKEQNHRVKNNLQVVSSLLNLQARRLSDEAARKAVEESRLRVQSMVIVHRRLYDGEKLAVINLRDFMQELVQGVLKAFGYPDVEPQLTVDPISLKVEKAIPLGLIMNELVTNVCKYAFPENETPELRISCQRKANKLECVVADNGPGFDNAEPAFMTDDRPPVAQTTSFGMMLIEAQVTQLSGTYSFSSGGEGTVFRMECKL
jgi:two-component sensor histidine kinase